MVSRIDKNKKQRLDVAKEEYINRTKVVSKRVLIVLIGFIIILVIIYGICRYVGTSGLVVKEYSLTYENLPDNFYGLKIIQISDLNYNKNTTDIKKVTKLVKKINSIRPDIIVFTGDLIYGKPSNNEISALEKEFNKLEATIGKYAVSGEDDVNSHVVLNNAGFIDLDNSYDLIYKDNYNPILIVGFDSDNSNIEKAFDYFSEENSQQDIFTIALMHKPDIIDRVLNYHHVDLAMAGHSLNGLIRFPKVGGLFTYNGAKKYYDCYYKIGQTDLYISGGIGMREYPYRLFNHPSINFYRLK